MRNALPESREIERGGETTVSRRLWGSASAVCGKSLTHRPSFATLTAGLSPAEFDSECLR